MLIEDLNEFEAVLRSTNKGSVTLPDFLLNEPEANRDELTRQVLRPLIVDNQRTGMPSVKNSIVHQRRASRKSPWADVNTFSLTTIKAGTEVKLSLGSERTQRLLGALLVLNKIAETELPVDATSLTVAPSNRVVILEGQEADALRQIKTHLGDGFGKVIDQLDPELLDELVHFKMHKERRAAVDEFKQALERNDWDENDWQKFFEKNEWIFGYGLSYKYLNKLQNQPYYGGTSIDRTGGQRGDFLLATASDRVRFTVLVEIKRPDTSLVTTGYRGKVYKLGTDLIGGVSQVQSNCRTWVQGALREENKDIWLTENAYTYEPKGILIIGHTAQLDDDGKKETFELFRRHMLNPEILTFDEVFKRAEFAVDEGRIIATTVESTEDNIIWLDDDDEL